MTGDIDTKNMVNIISMDKLEQCCFLAIKAPHHGTESHFSKEFLNLSTFVWLIPHYFTKRKIKKVSIKYHSKKHILICTRATGICEIEDIYGCTSNTFCSQCFQRFLYVI